MARINDLDLSNWKEYDDIITDSLWLIGERDRGGAHDNFYHGNFIPQIPNQLMRRYTQTGDVVLDTFLGYGTTLIEAKRLGRNGIGVELIPEVADAAEERIGNQLELPGIGSTAQVIRSDSATAHARAGVEAALEQMGRDSVQLILMHPPYHDIIKFSDNEADLCNADTVEEFIEKFGAVIGNFADLLDRGRYLAVVIGDKYTKSEWVPLGFHLMSETLKWQFRPNEAVTDEANKAAARRGRKLTLKSILVKNMVNNRAKINQESLWRYRALVGGFYIFKHEYILIFRKA